MWNTTVSNYDASVGHLAEFRCIPGHRFPDYSAMKTTKCLVSQERDPLVPDCTRKLVLFHKSVFLTLFYFFPAKMSGYITCRINARRFYCSFAGRHFNEVCIVCCIKTNIIGQQFVLSAEVPRYTHDSF